jgi:cation diffusion facilitator CzcD-associated flavoprotein CzcO
LNNWKWPDVEGLHDFQGQLMHSAKWDHSVNFQGKRVGIIGTGSSSVQIVPQIQSLCKELTVFMRSPTYISPPFGTGALTSALGQELSNDASTRQYKFTEEQKKRFRDDPAYHLQFRKTIEAEICGAFQANKRNSELNNGFRTIIKEEMYRRIGPGHDELKDFIIPKWSPGCRRISPGDGYLEALAKDNVKTAFGEIQKVTTTGVVSQNTGELHELDVLICATGFQPGFRPAFEVVGRTGKTIQEDWGSNINMYFGISAPR